MGDETKILKEISSQEFLIVAAPFSHSKNTIFIGNETYPCGFAAYLQALEQPSEVIQLSPWDKYELMLQCKVL